MWTTLCAGVRVGGKDLLKPGIIPREYSLSQNYPDPFNPSAIIRFTIPMLGLVSLTVHNVLGLQVAVLVNQIKSPGTYTATFDATGLPSGIYFYRLQAGEYLETKKLILLK